ncbi:MAG: ubiquinol-cytochrome c reductase iron-sulfur subunit [Acidobacteria bacterium]|nr:ubiquinol-cytochrome c reductase iron-sulfur subunit [Acidobacteriota bacterium]
MSGKTEPSRRSFHTTFIYGLWGLIAGALALPAAIYLLVPGRKRQQDQWVEAGEAARFSARTPEEVVFRRNRVDGWKVTSEKTTAWVVRLSEREVVAYAPQCTHLGCAYHWDARSGHFLCPCHSSAFSLEGQVLSGPAPRPLDRYQARIADGKLLLGPVQERQS